MKKALAGVLAAVAVVGLLASGAMAQVPFFQVYFDDDSNGSYGETQSQCGTVNDPDSVYLVVQNFNMFLAAVEYQIAFPAGMMFVADNYPAVTGGYLNIGDSQSGNAVAYSTPRNGFDPLLISTITVLWTGLCTCPGPQPLVVLPYPNVPIKPQPVGVRWPDYVEVGAVGMTSLICPGPVSTTPTTWGGIKALYR
jgi:hypothetical protein